MGNLNETAVIQPKDILTRNPKVEIRDEDSGKYLLFNMQNLESYVINETGKLIWDSINYPKSAKDIVDDIEGRILIAKSNSSSPVWNYLNLLFLKKLICRTT